jgi:Holliday junction resolvasome RuvABC endonuclease subunit
MLSDWKRLKMSKLILGLDLSSTKTGYCILDTENKKIIESGTIDLGGGTLRERLAVLRNDIRELESTYYFHSCYCERLNPTMSKQTSFAFGALMGFI